MDDTIGLAVLYYNIEIHYVMRSRSCSWHMQLAVGWMTKGSEFKYW
jgi:hypothetical protein